MTNKSVCKKAATFHLNNYVIIILVYTEDTEYLKELSKIPRLDEVVSTKERLLQTMEACVTGTDFPVEYPKLDCY